MISVRNYLLQFNTKRRQFALTGVFLYKDVDIVKKETAIHEWKAGLSSIVC
jgi:hypothetical protein